MQPSILSPNRFLLYLFLINFRRFGHCYVCSVKRTWCLSRASRQKIILRDFVKIGFECSWPFWALIRHLWLNLLCFVRGPIFRWSCLRWWCSIRRISFLRVFSLWSFWRGSFSDFHPEIALDFYCYFYSFLSRISGSQDLTENSLFMIYQYLSK